MNVVEPRTNGLCIFDTFHQEINKILNDVNSYHYLFKDLPQQKPPNGSVFIYERKKVCDPMCVNK